MTATLTTMWCLKCTDQALQSVMTPRGLIDRCPACESVFIEHKMLAALAEDKDQLYATLQEAQALLLPTVHTCPKCFQKLYHGRVRSLKLILTLCPPCKTLWADPQTLRRMDENIERALRTEIDQSLYGPAPATASDSAHTILQPSAIVQKPLSRPDGKGFVGFLRRLAWTLDHWADRLSGSASVLPSSETLSPTLEPTTLAPIEALPLPDPVQVDVPPAPTTSMGERPSVALPREEKIDEPISDQASLVDLAGFLIEDHNLTDAAKDAGFAAWRAEMMHLQGLFGRPANFLKKLMTPRKSKARTLPPPSEKATPVEKLPVQPIQQDTPLVGTNCALQTSGGRSPQETAFPKTPSPLGGEGGGEGNDVRCSQEAHGHPSPAALPSVGLALSPKGRGEISQFAAKLDLSKSKILWMDRIAAWLPTVLPGLAILLNLFRDTGFDGVYASGWSLLGWATGAIFRLVWMYPFKRSHETVVKALGDESRATNLRGVPIMLKGQIVVNEKSQHGSKVSFLDESGTIALNALRRLELMPRLLGLTDLARFPKNDISLKGWYRLGPIPSIEVEEVRTPKTYRKSPVRTLRWVGAVGLLILALLLIFSGE